jgi:hypothetical protein
VNRLVAGLGFVIACGPEARVPASSGDESGIELPDTSSTTEPEPPPPPECEVDLLAVAERCAVGVPQETALSGTGASLAFTGRYAFYGVEQCAYCLQLGHVQVWVFEDEPETPDWSFEEVTDAAIRFTMTTTHDGTVEGELAYRHRDADIGPLFGVASVTVTEAPQLSAFVLAETDDDLPHVRLVVDGGSGDIQVDGEIDAVFCNGAGYTSPCE